MALTIGAFGTAGLESKAVALAGRFVLPAAALPLTGRRFGTHGHTFPVGGSAFTPAQNRRFAVNHRVKSSNVG